MASDTGTDVAQPPQMALVPAPSPTPMQLLDRALQSGVEMDKLEKLMELQERWEAREARKAFDAAVADAKAEIPVITKNRKGHNSKYADLGAFAAAVNPVLAKYGLSYRYRSEQEGASIRVTCVLSHRDGHAEETTLSGGADTSGSKNSIQAIASTLTYLQRYTLKLALGLADSEGDDDGQAAGGDEPIADDELSVLHAKIDAAQTDAAKLSAYLRVDSLPRLPKSRLGEAHKMLDERMKVLAAKKKAPRP